MEDAAVRAVPCALECAWLPCVGVAFTGHPRPLPKTKYLPRYRSVRYHPTSQTIYNSYLDQDFNTIRRCLGILGRNASTSIIDTSLYGDITIELTLAPAGLLMLSPPVGTLATLHQRQIQRLIYLLQAVQVQQQLQPLELVIL